MSQTLYQKYRPTSFVDVAGQDHVKTILLNQLKAGTVAHAYLFTGPRGVGKTTLARLLAKAVNCEKLNNGEPCASCAGCLAVSEGKTMDVFEIDAASHTGVDNVRENVIEAVRFAPTSLKRKVFIIDEVHGLSTPAFNALLKTLEEPPAHVLFILATTELHKVPETIVSRCQRFDFHRLSAAIIVDRLSTLAKQESVKVDAEVFASIARLSEGCLRDAESLLGQVLAIGDGQKITMLEASLIIPVTNMGVVLRYLDAVSRVDSATAIDAVRDALASGARIEPLQEEILEALQWMLLQVIGSKQTSTVYDQTTQDQLQQMGSVFGLRRIDQLMKRLLEYRQAYRSERIPQLPLELLAIESVSASTLTVSVSPQKVVAPPPMPVESAPTPAFVSTPVVPVVTQTRTIATEPVDAVISYTGSLKTTLQQVKSKWGECCTGLSEISGTLPVMLSDVEILGIDGATLRIGTKISFIADKLNEPKNRGVISSMLEKVFQESMGIKAELTTAPADELVAELIGEFGGQIV